MTASISRFTPSMMRSELLEQLFVGREDLLTRIMDRVAEAASRDSRNHTLLVGPRGAGKTHLVALAYHRTRALIDDGAALHTSWLAEDPWRIVSYRHLLAAILAALDGSHEESPGGDTAALEARILSAASSGPIVVFLENLDQILDQLGDDGQQRLRHLLQDQRPLLLIATTTRLDRDLSDQARPFYGFFTTTRLAPFSAETASQMLARIALVQGDPDIAAYLETDEAENRLKVIEHLAGGQPRLWALFGSALTVAGVRDLTSLLVDRFDDLTPYYQEQLSGLSPQQRLVISELAVADKPLNVQALAHLVDSPERSVAKTLSDLVDRRWVIPCDSPLLRLGDRRRTYYELAEPLARIAFQLKETRDGAPVRLVVDFLKSWFSEDELAHADQDDAYVVEATSGAPESIGVARRLRRLPVSRVPAIRLWGTIDDALAQLMTGDPSAVMDLSIPVRSALEDAIGQDLDLAAIHSARLQIHSQAAEDFGTVRHPEMARWIERAEDLAAHTVNRGSALACLSGWYSRAWQFGEAESIMDRVIEASGPESLTAIETRAELAAALLASGQAQGAVTHLQALVVDCDVSGADHPNTLASRNNLASAYESAGDLGRAIPLYEDTLTTRERVLGPDHPDTLASRNNLAGAYRSAGDLGRAIPLYEDTLTDRERVLGPNHPDTLTSRNNLAGAYKSAGDLGRAIPLYEQTLTASERVLGPDHPNTLTSRNNLASAYESAGDLGRAIPLYEDTLTASERVLGPDHPNTLTSGNNLAGAYHAAGDLGRAIPLYEHTLTDRERVLGPDHPDTLTSRKNLASAYHAAGDLGRAIPLYEHTLTESNRVLGPDHPITAMIRTNLAAALGSASDVVSRLSS